MEEVSSWLHVAPLVAEIWRGVVTDGLERDAVAPCGANDCLEGGVRTQLCAVRLETLLEFSTRVAENKRSARAGVEASTRKAHKTAKPLRSEPALPAANRELWSAKIRLDYLKGNVILGTAFATVADDDSEVKTASSGTPSSCAAIWQHLV